MKLKSTYLIPVLLFASFSFFSPHQALADYYCSPGWPWSGEWCTDDQVCSIDCISESMPYTCFGTCITLSTCADFGWTGTWPDCDMSPPPTCASAGYNSGTYPDCYNVCGNGSPGPYPSCPIAPTCTPDTSCAAGTCPLNTCTATAADCSTYPVGGTNFVACIATCTPDTSCAASTCNTTVCSATAADCSTYPIPGTKTDGACAACTPSAACATTTPVGSNCSDSCGNIYAGTQPIGCVASAACAASTCNDGSTCTDACGNSYLGTNPGSCAAPPPPSVSCSPALQKIAVGGTAIWNASVVGPATAPYTWRNAFNVVIGSGLTLSKVYSAADTYSAAVTASNGSGGTVTSTSCLVIVGGGCLGGAFPTITANPTRVPVGNTSVITYSASGVPAGIKCTITGKDIGGPGVNSIQSNAAGAACNVDSGNATVSITEQRTYTITCAGVSQQVVVNIVPKVREF